MSYDSNGSDGHWLSKHAKDELTFIFRSIVQAKFQKNITFAWYGLMEKFLNDSSNGIPANGKDRSSARGNMNKALRSGTMSWKIFKVALKFLGAHRVKFQVAIDWGPNSPITVHHITRNLKGTPLKPDEKDRLADVQIVKTD